MSMTPIQKQILKQLQVNPNINGIQIAVLIDDHRTVASRTKGLYERYKATEEGLPILNRKMPNAQKINSKINNDFFSEIIDTKVGYMSSISYALDKNEYLVDGQTESPEYTRHTQALSKFSLRNNLTDLDAELIKMVSICGHAGREIYIDKEGNERIVNLNAWETIFLTNGVGEVEFALRYYKVVNLGNLMTSIDDTYVTRVEVYDNANVTYFVEDIDHEGNSVYILDMSVPVNPSLHVFDYTPITKVVNNEEELGDAEKVLELIDAYDRAISDINSEIEQFRLAYMYFKGEEPDEEMIESAKQTGGYYVGENGEVGFITKSIDDAVVEHHLDRIEQNILRFAKHINFNDEAFGGNLSGVAMRYKLFALESKSKILETKITTALRNQFKIVSSAWAKKSIKVDYLNVYYTFSRNIPVNLLDEADTSSKLKGLVSERTRLSLLSFVDDVEYELEQIAQDSEASVNLLDAVDANNEFNINDVSGETVGGA
jgi:SPP1 family phage portal protein